MLLSPESIYNIKQNSMRIEKTISSHKMSRGRNEFDIPDLKKTSIYFSHSHCQYIMETHREIAQIKVQW